MYNIKLDFSLENNVVGDNINIVFASWMKKSLEEYDNELYKSLYENSNNKVKTYTYCVKMRSLKYKDRQVYLANNAILVEFTNANFEELLRFYNAFLVQKKSNKRFSMNKNSMVLRRIRLEKLDIINDDEVVVKMESPLMVRYVDDNNKDQYLYAGNERFEKILNYTVINILKEFGLDNEKVEIEYIKGKKTVANVFRHKANATLGYFKIKGNPQCISILRETGIGSRRAAGFGKFKIIG